MFADRRLRLVTLLAAAAVVVVVALLLVPGKTHRTAPAGPARYYVALGDSLALGMQPDPTGNVVASRVGYVNALYAYYRRQIPNLKLVEFGCSGETIDSMLAGHPTDPAKPLGCSNGGQLAAAQAFLRTHSAKGEVPLLTIDIGMQDVACVRSTTVASLICMYNAIESVGSNAAALLQRLQRVVPAGTVTAGMSAYSPLLGSFSGTSGGPLLDEAVVLMDQVNASLVAAYRKSHFLVADVATAFDIANIAPTKNPSYGNTPANVVAACTLTWQCAPAPQGPSFLPNATGYGLIAARYEHVIGTL